MILKNKQLYIYIYKQKEYKVVKTKKQTKKNKKIGVFLGLWLLVHQTGYEVIPLLQSSFKCQLLLK